MSFRFSRDKRLFSQVTFAEFMSTATALAAMMRTRRPSATIEILTFEETGLDRKYRNAVFSGDSTMERHEFLAYPLESFNEDIWRRAYDAQITIKDPADKQPFMICVSCSQRPVRKSLYFYGQCVDEALFARIYDIFATPDLWTSIGSRYNNLSIIGAVEHKRVA
ncbi:MAG TPA: hypothetical protein VEB18_02135 [Candidatus Paceibacterota bacterium]|nr:hypothetical protein [Candidatus Paceibacterota bacterium]